MATKTTTATATAVEAENSYEPVYIPKQYAKDDSQFVGVNGRHYLIQKGKTVMVPREVAEVIRNSQLNDEQAQAYIDSMTAE